MGGVLVIATLDNKQLPPIRSKPSLMSTLVITNYRMKCLHYSVRARGDQYLRRAIEIGRKQNPTEEEIEEFQNIIITQCHHVQSWDDPLITADVVRILGRKKAVKAVETNFMKQLEQNRTIFAIRMAENLQTVPSAHGNWRQAQDNVVSALNGCVNEVNELRLYSKMIVEFTHNKPNSYSNSQMGILVDLPDQAVLDAWQPFEVLAAPPGVRYLPENVNPITKASLQQCGWRPVLVGPAPEITHYLYNGIAAKRKQYGIRHRLAMTLHRAMGSDLKKIATCVCSDDGSGYNLWMKEQLIVLISRTHECPDMIFVGPSPQRTAQVLAQLLRITSPYSHYMDHVVNVMTGTEDAQVMRPLRYLPYNLRHQVIHTHENGYVYCIMSLATYSHTNIGTTHDLHKRIRQHNSATGGAMATRNLELQPWVCIGYVVGFEDKSDSRNSFEKHWQQIRNYRGRNQLSPMEVLQIGIELVDEKNGRPGTHLMFVQCIEHRSQVENSDES